MNRRQLLTILVGAPLVGTLTAVAAACGGGGSSEPAETVPPGALVVTAGPGIVFDKGEYAAAAGNVVIALVGNDGATRHTLLVKGADGVVVGPKLDVVRSGDIDTGTFPLTPGTYEVYCDVPGHGAMKATLVVT